jgi:hypothetical protein
MRALVPALMVGLCCSTSAFAQSSAAHGPPTHPQPSAAGSPSTAFYYGQALPREIATVYDQVVVQPEHAGDPKAIKALGAEPVAYFSVGEAAPSQANALAPAWVLARNAAWASLVMDLASAEYRAYLLERFETLYARGYSRFFLDTLDSYQLGAKTEAARAKQRDGTVELLRAMKSRHPGVQLVVNRGFELLPQIAPLVSGVVAESLFDRWDAGRKQYTRVPDADRTWLLARLNEAHERYRLPVTVIDYRPTQERDAARETAKRILKLGFEPWVCNADLSDVGVGRYEIFPRRVMLLTDTPLKDGAAVGSGPLTWLAPILEYLGYVPELRSVHAGLPNETLAGRYAGVITWFEGGSMPSTYGHWMVEQTRNGTRFAVFGALGFSPTSPEARELGFAPARGGASGPPLASPSVRGSANSTRASASATTRSTAEGARPTAADSIANAAKSASSAGSAQSAALATAGARATSAIVSRDALIGFETEPPLHPVPGTGLVLEGVGVTRHLRAVDQAGNVCDAIATAAWGGVASSHVFGLRGLHGERAWALDPFAFLTRALQLPAMPVPDVTTENGRRLALFLIETQGAGERARLRGRPATWTVLRDELLAPFGWPHAFHGSAADGDRDAAKSLLQLSAAYAGELPAGDTEPRGRFGSLTQVQPMATQQANGLAIPAPIAWDSRFIPGGSESYPFERVIETLEFTDAPRRIKPIALHYHAYTAASPAGLEGLKRIYGWVAAHQVLPIRVTEYIARVRAFRDQVLARDLEGAWWMYGDRALRTVRIPDQLGLPDLAASSGVAAVSTLAQGHYVSFAGEAQRKLVLGAASLDRPHVVAANGQFTRFDVESGRVQFEVSAAEGLQLTLAGLPASTRCELRLSHRYLRVTTSAGRSLELRLPERSTGPSELRCGASE